MRPFAFGGAGLLHWCTSSARAPGFLGIESRIGNPALALQYWRSFEHVEQYAIDSAGLHHPTWAAFNRAVAGNGDVGIWLDLAVRSHRARNPGRLMTLESNL